VIVRTKEFAVEQAHAFEDAVPVEQAVVEDRNVRVTPVYILAICVYNEPVWIKGHNVPLHARQSACT
jgi:hypothetical protein